MICAIQSIDMDKIMGNSNVKVKRNGSWCFFGCCVQDAGWHCCFLHSSLQDALCILYMRVWGMAVPPGVLCTLARMALAPIVAYLGVNYMSVR